jgi:hypothetical protein
LIPLATYEDEWRYCGLGADCVLRRSQAFDWFQITLPRLLT